MARRDAAVIGRRELGKEQGRFGIWGVAKAEALKGEGSPSITVLTPSSEVVSST